MSFLGFGGNYNKPGPGINKDAPEKKGFKLMFDILGREFWGLWALNFYFLAACLPIITIGPATIAMYRVIITMLRDENVYVLGDFITAFKKNFKLGVLFGIPFTIFFACGIYLNFNLVFNIAAGTTNTITIAMMLLWTLFTVSVFSFILPMLAYIDLSPIPLIKNSVFLIFLGKFRTLGAVVLTVGAYAVVALYAPISIMVLLFAGFFSFLTFFSSFLIWPVIDKYVLHGNDTPEDNENSKDKDEQLSLNK